MTLFKAYSGEKETYMFRSGQSFRSYFLLEKEVERGKLIFHTNDEIKLHIHSKKISEEEGKFKIEFQTDSLSSRRT